MTTVIAPAREADAPTTEFLLRFVEAAHAAGYATEELEQRVNALADALDVEAQVSATPTQIELSVGPLSSQRTHTLRVRPGGIDLGSIARLDELVRSVLDTRLHADSALRALERILATPFRRHWLVVLAAYGAAGAALTPMVGGGWREALAAAVVGLAVGGIALPIAGDPRLESVLAPLAAIVASFSSVVLCRYVFHASPDVVTLAALITLLPGMTLTVGVRELASEELQSGVANTAKALVQLLGLVFGVEIGRSIAHGWFGLKPEHAAHPSALPWQLVAAAAAGLAFTVTLRARTRDAWVMCGATVLALAANEAGKALLGAQAGVFGAALAVGVAGGVVGARLRLTPLLFIVPGVLMLVPGSVGFRSALQLLENQPVDGITTAFDTFVSAISIAYGLMIAAVVLPRRFSEISPRRSSS